MEKSFTKDGARWFTCRRCGLRNCENIYRWKKKPQPSYPCLYHGGSYSQGQNRGPFYVDCDSTSSSGGDIGCRLQERPPKAA